MSKQFRVGNKVRYAWDDNQCIQNLTKGMTGIIVYSYSSLSHTYDDEEEVEMFINWDGPVEFRQFCYDSASLEIIGVEPFDEFKVGDEVMYSHKTKIGDYTKIEEFVDEYGEFDDDENLVTKGKIIEIDDMLDDEYCRYGLMSTMKIKWENRNEARCIHYNPYILSKADSVKTIKRLGYSYNPGAKTVWDLPIVKSKNGLIIDE